MEFTKEDYYYDGTELIESNHKQAVRCFKKALEIDDEYIDAYNGLGSVYFLKNSRISKEYFQKAYELTKNFFKEKWPEEINWGILENRQYLRAMHGYGLLLWREKKDKEAMDIFKLILKLNKNDNQGARYLVASLYEGISWNKGEEDPVKEAEILERQNKKHKFFEWPEE